jgi:hypothetical protein
MSVIKQKFFAKYKMQNIWWLGFLSLTAVPNLINHVQGKDYYMLTYLSFLFLLRFIPENRKDPMKISVSELEIYKNNPEKIENLANPEKVRYRFLLTIFLLGLVFVIVSKLIFPILQNLLTVLWLDVLEDRLFELGVVIWGGSITVYLIQFLSVREEQEINEKKEAIEALLKEEQ